MSIVRWLSLGLSAATLLSGCRTSLPAPNLGNIYDRAAKVDDAHRNPVIVIPGILGSRLLETGSQRVAWGAFSGDYANPQTADGARLLALPLTTEQTRGDAQGSALARSLRARGSAASGVALAELRDDVVPAGVLDRTRIDLLGLPIELQAYSRILATLGVGGYRDELLGRAGAVDYGPLHYTCFQFAYDWRRDNVENARRLGEFIREKSEYIRDIRRKLGQDADAPVKFDIVAHSMGGLVARYYLMYGDAEPSNDARSGSAGAATDGAPTDSAPTDGASSLLTSSAHAPSVGDTRAIGAPAGANAGASTRRTSRPPAPTWPGAAHVERAIFIGTPNAGSLNSLVSLVDGVNFGPLLPNYPAAVLGTMPSIYQLLPRTRHGVLVDATGARMDADLLNAATWERFGWGLAARDAETGALLRTLLPDARDDAERRAIALAHLRACLSRARQFQSALDQPATPPAGLSLYLFAGDAVRTRAVGAVDGRGRLRVAEWGPGDGTVLRQSALCDERTDATWTPGVQSPIAWRRAQFLSTNHLGLTFDPAFSDNVLYLLLEDRRP
ncbi:MAG: esterase/lipase family protein [Phycisphaerae bacterium]